MSRFGTSTSEAPPGNRDFQGTNMMAGFWSEQIHAAAFRAIRASVPPRAKMLDVGAGRGAFSKRLINAGYDVVAIEGFAEFHIPSVKCWRANLNEDWPTSIGEPFDGIAAVEIIEHLENPFHFARQAHAKLRPNGKLVITTPNPLSILARWHLLLTGKLALLEHEDHRTPIYPQTVARLADECGFHVIERTFDGDPLRVSSSLKGYVAKTALRVLSPFCMRDREFLEGNSNVWLLEAV